MEIHAYGDVLLQQVKDKSQLPPLSLVNRRDR
jgi:hypothetical protein